MHPLKKFFFELTFQETYTVNSNSGVPDSKQPTVQKQVTILKSLYSLIDNKTAEEQSAEDTRTPQSSLL